MLGVLVAVLGACGGEVSEDDAGHGAARDGGQRAADAGAGVDAGAAGELDAGEAAGDAGVEVDDAGVAPEDAGTQPGQPDAGSAVDAGGPIDAGVAPQPCVTRVTYGSAWFHPSNHPADFDEVSGVVTWDGVCVIDANGNSKATLSNGWQPIFRGRSSCVIALDQRGDCPTAAPATCSTRVGYGPSWLRAPNHPADFDDVAGAVTWDGVCRAGGADSFAQLSNGWTPYFGGSNACDVSLRYQSCGGLYANPVVDADCPDPGVMKAGDTWYAACTGGRFALRSSKDLVHWTSRGNVLSSTPSWAANSFWAPELHQVGNGYVAYFSARHTNGVFALGAATSSTPQGPYTPQAQPLLQVPSPGAIDVHFFRSSAGQNYLLWKIDGNAVGQSTPIRIQTLSADGLTLTGQPTTILSNTLAWEGALVEGPWMIEEGGYFYLFYSANGYASANYGIGVARATSPTGPFTKHGAAILVSRGAWAGPGHGSVVRGPKGEWVLVYHSWKAGSVGQSPGRVMLVDRVVFSGGWPSLLAAPSSHSQPLP